MTRSAAYQARRRAAAIARGDCLQCCKRPATVGVRCDDCLAWQRAWHRSRQRIRTGKNRCSNCGTVGHIRPTCPLPVRVEAVAIVPVTPSCADCAALGFACFGCAYEGADQLRAMSAMEAA